MNLPLATPEQCRPFGRTVLVYSILAVILLWSALAMGGNQPQTPPDYTLLLSYIQMEDRKGPLVEFKETGGGIDSNLSRENRRFIGQNKSLLSRIRKELNTDQINWELVDATKRLMVVPESHPAYADLFESYCRLAVDHVLEATALPNPYRAIATLDHPPTEMTQPEDGGITAYLVHNIADVYTEEYAFFDASNAKRKVRIKLDNRVYLGEIGSYSSYLVINADNHYHFERNPYTLWRNSAQNPMNVLIAPVEETLHIVLRTSTERAILRRLNEKPPSTRGDIETVVEEWLAIEEAVVGGLVSTLLPSILDRIMADDIRVALHQALDDRHAIPKYRFLDRGIDAVSQLGLDLAIQLYQEHPRRFKLLLTNSPGEAPEIPEDDAAACRPHDPTA